jgi:hypothetical protein
MPTLRHGAVATVVALALSLSVVFTVGAANAAPKPKATSATDTVVLTNSSNGSTVLATKGELVVVKLTGGPLRWSEAQAIESSPVLVRLAGSSTNTGSSTTTFEVESDGTASVEATGTSICGIATACPQYVLLWRATVVVPQQDPPAAP